VHFALSCGSLFGRTISKNLSTVNTKPGLLFELNKTIFVLVPIVKQMEEVFFFDVVDLVFAKKLNQIFNCDFVAAVSVNSLKSGPGLKAMHLGKLCPLFLDNLLVFRN